MRHKDLHHGVTLIEMLGVLGIIAILLGFTVAVLPRLQRKAKGSAAMLEIARIGAAMRTYHEDWGFYPPNTYTSAADTAKPVDLAVYERLSAKDRLPPDSRGMIRCLKCIPEASGRSAYIELDPSRLITMDDDSDASTPAIPVRYLDPFGGEWAYVPFPEYAFTYACGSRNLRRGVYHYDESAGKERAWNEETFQLRSAGADREFDTEDDIANFAR